MKILEVIGLGVGYRKTTEISWLVTDFNLSVGPGDSVSLLGASGSGKTTAACAMIGLLPPPLRLFSGEIRYKGRTLRPDDRAGWREIRGGRILMLFQSPSAALNPTVRVGTQIAESLVDVHGWRPADARHHSREILETLGISSHMEKAYPHELSGGMRQRVLIGVALALEPEILIADEPGVGLDPDQRVGIINLLCDIHQRKRMAMIVITHDPSVASRLTGTTLVMSQGRIVETGPVHELLLHPQHPYTRDLVESRCFLEGSCSK